MVMVMTEAGASGHHPGGTRAKHRKALELGEISLPTKPGTLLLETVIQSALESFPSLIAATKRKDMAAGDKLAA
jgi:hypothetical protein